MSARSAGERAEMQESAESEGSECDAALSCELVFTTRLPSVLPFPVGRKREFVPVQAGKKPAATAITTAAWSAQKQRLYAGLSNGDVCFWPLGRDGAQQLKYVGSHKGPVTCLCLPKRGDGELGASGLLLSGSVDGNIKIWDYLGKVGSEPTVCVQTLYGHSRTITGLFTYGDYILSSSTDKTVKVWRAVPGREQLVYPWYNLQATAVTLTEWVRCMSYDRSKEVGDLGSFFAVDEAGGVVRIVPHSVHDHDDRTNKGFVFSVPGASSSQHLSSAGASTLLAPVPSTMSLGLGSAAGGWSPGATGSDAAAAGGAAPVPHAIPVVHDRGVLLVRYVAEWHLLLTLCYDNCLRAYDSDTGEVQHTWTNESRCLFLDLEVDVEYKEVLAVDEQGVLSIFSIKAGALLATKTVATSRVVKITAVLGRHLYAVMTEHDLSVWHLNHELDYNLLRGGHTRAVISLYACAGGSGAQPNDRDYRIFSAGMDNTVRLWDPYDMACVRVHDEAHSEITAMTFYEAWNILVTGHDNGDIRLWDLDTGPWAVLQQHTNSVTSLVMAMIRKNEELLISGGYDGMVVLWDIRTLRNEPPHMIAKFRAHGLDPGKVPALVASAAKVASVSPLLGAHHKGSSAAPSGSGRPPSSEASAAARRIEALIPALSRVDGSSAGGAPAESSSDDLAPEVTVAGGIGSGGRPGSASAVAASIGGGGGSAGAAVAAREEEVGGATITTLTLEAGPPQSGAAGQHGSVAGVAAGGRLGSGSGGAPEPVRTLDLLLARARAVAAVRDAEELQRQGEDGAQPLADPSALGAGGGGGDPLAGTLLDVQALQPEVLVVRFDPAKKVIITGGNDHVIKVWTTNGYAQVGQHLGHTDAVTAMALDANLLFSGSEDCTIRVWDTVPATLRPEPSGPGNGAALLGQPAATALLGLAPAAQAPRADQPFVGHALKVLTGHTRCVTGLEMSPHGGHLVSCSLDGSLRLWDYVTGAGLAKFTHHEEMRCLALRTDKAEVLVGTNQASILRYSIDSVPAVGAGGASTTGGMMDLAALGIFSADGALQQGSNRSGTAGSTSSKAGGRHAAALGPGGSRTQSPLPSSLSEAGLGDDGAAHGGRGNSAGTAGREEAEEGEEEEQERGSGEGAGGRLRSQTSRTPPLAGHQPGRGVGRGGTAGSVSISTDTSRQGTAQSQRRQGSAGEAGKLGDGAPGLAGGASAAAAPAGATGDGKPDPWRWGTAKLQLLPKAPPKLSASEMLALLDKQRAAGSSR